MAKVYYQKCVHCGKEAFRYKDRPYDRMNVASLDKANHGQLIKCGKCGEIVFQKDLNPKNLGVIDEPDC